MLSTRTSIISAFVVLLMLISAGFGMYISWNYSGGSQDSFEPDSSPVISEERPANVVVTGNANLTISYLGSDNEAKSIDKDTILFGNQWTPGHKEVVYLTITNNGENNVNYSVGVNVNSETGSVNIAGEEFKLSDHLMFGFAEEFDPAGETDIVEALSSSEKVSSGVSKSGTLTAEQNSVTLALVVYLPESSAEAISVAAGQQMPEISLGLSLLATQPMGGNNSVELPELPEGFTASTTVTDVVTDGVLSSTVTIGDGQSMGAVLPEGVKLEEGATEVTLSVNNVENSEANITLNESETQLSLDVHISGIAADNTVPMEVTLGGVAANGLNSNNIRLYHVENGETVEMIRLAMTETFTSHNQYKYDPVTGKIILYIASFSEIAVVSEPAKWNGNFNYDWYDAKKTEFVIANADQLAAFGAIVGGMNKVTGRNDDGTYTYSDEIIRDSFKGKIVKLVADICIGDITDEDGRNLVFYPIGYYNNTGRYEKVSGKVTVNGELVAVSSGYRNFEGTFDGNGHTISDFYQNTWEMFGDYNDGYSGTPNHSRDGMGLFGRVYGGTIKNLTVKNFSSDGEFATTGTIAAYADGATFENIAIFNCNPRVYNIGNGGIVGCVGWYAKDANLKTTFKNITVDNTNKISALWGSWDVACGGIVGQYYPTSGQSSAKYPVNGGIHFENCHVAAQIDVYNDVCANYQYYAYRYAGILLGSVRENVTIDGHEYPNMNGITATGCTVHFGDWNDYYYCELVANSLASYTHDHQMSRLTQIEKIDLTTMKYIPLGETEWKDIPTSGRVNYVVVNAKNAEGKWIHGDGANGEYATCYHFVNGVQHKHDVADSDNPNVYETVDGVEVLKEDKQVIYREFNNLVTGYGWGVTSKGVDDLDGVAILDRQEGDSEVKFAVQDTISHQYRANNERAIGKLFKAAVISDPKLEIKSNQVIVTVSPKPGTDSTAGGIFKPNTSDWTKGTIMFTGKGAAIVTITDYYYCISTTVEVDVVENRVTGLSVKTNKNLYDISRSETFKPTEITVTAVYSDGNARNLSVSEFTYAFKENAGDFTTFGEKTAVVYYTYAEETVSTEFKVVCVNMRELTLVGVPEVEGEQRIERYFEQFGINGLGQKYYTDAHVGAEGIDMNKYGHSATLNFATGSVNYVINSHAGAANTTDNPDDFGKLTINCSTSPFADIFGYVGYADRVPIAFGVYVDTTDNLSYTLPMANNADIVKLTGTENSRIFYIQAPLNTMNLSAGEHTVRFISIFDDGIQELTTWTVNISGKEEIDISKKTANVIILAGQSNAYGASALTEAVKAQAVTADYSNVFINYSNINCENGVWKSLYFNSGFEPYHPGVGGTLDGACFGPEVGIAYQLATNKDSKDEVWYIIKYTAAGSILDGQWLEGTYDNEGLVGDMGGYLSDLMIDYVHDSLAKIEAIHGDNNINLHSFVWMQGESDALASDCAAKYQANEAALVNKVRNEFASYAKNGYGNNIIFVSGAIAKYADITITQNNTTASNGWVYSDTINNAKKTNALIEWEPVSNTINNPTSCVIPNSVYIDTYTLLVGANAGENTDVYHYSSVSMWSLGQWFGIAINYVNGLGLNNVDPSTVQYTVTYNANGGSVNPPSATANGGSSVILPTPTRNGYRFLGWKDSTNTYDAGAEYTVNGDVTLTAQWAKTYNITVKDNAANFDVDVTPTVAIQGETITIIVTNTSNSSRNVTIRVGNTNIANRVSVNAGQSVTYTYTMTANNVAITVS